MMDLDHAVQLEYILGRVSVGVAILDPTDFRIQYANPYLLLLLDEARRQQEIVGHPIAEVIPEIKQYDVLSRLREIAATGRRMHFSEIPYEGFLEARGRTYWQITVERMPAHTVPAGQNGDEAQAPLLITIEDVTSAVRSRLHLNAIHHISSAIASASALPKVLDRILQALNDMVGSRRCAILLIDQSELEPAYQEARPGTPEGRRTVMIAAQKGIHPRSLDWHPQVDVHLPLGRVMHSGRTLMITDTRTTPDVELPYLDDHGSAVRPGSVLCVPIFDSYPAGARLALGAIEVYHIRTRGFPAEEIALLEQFSLQAGLAIQNARLFRSTERWAQEASRSAQQRENIMQAIPDGLVIYDERWRVREANYAARTLFGWSDEVIGLPITEALVRGKARIPKEFSGIPDLLAVLEGRALAGESDEFKIIGADGQPYTLRCSYTPLLDEAGDIFAFIVIYHDVTKEAEARERIEAEVVARTAELAQRNAALQQAKAAQELASARMELLLERLPSGVLLVSADDGSLSIINRRAVQLLQHMELPLEPRDDPDEAARRAIGLNWEILLNQVNLYGTSGALVPNDERPLARALRGEASEAELHANGEDGETVHLLVNAAPLRSPDGAVTSAILVMHDITTIKELERVREDFFTTMAHELKTPLANIRAHLSALLAEDMQWSGRDQYEFLQTADEQVERLVGMVNHFLDASRIEAGALRLELEPILIPEMLEDLQDRLEALINSSQRRLQINQPQQLPAVLADYELIMSVLTNLLSNAFRYAPEGDVVILDVEPVLDGRSQQPVSVTLRVTDHGPGMNSEQQAALFMRFSTFAALDRPAADRPGQPALERRRGTARWSPGTGLGLYISRGIVEAHGSTLTLKSSPGEGASFAFTLPVASKHDEV
jgi:PAS domain S-box-containing protein